MFKPISIDNRIIIVDDFYQDPDAIRNMALTMEKESESGGNYGGIMTNDAFLTKEHMEIFSTLLGESLKPATALTGKFRFTQMGDPYKHDIHFDPACSFASVVYLSKKYPRHCAGTVFWKHKRTGLESIPLTQDGIEKHGWNNVDDLKQFLDTDGIDYSLWDKTFVLPYKYNRAVFFRPWLFHSPGPAFGNTLESSRMIQTIFLTGENNG